MTENNRKREIERNIVNKISGPFVNFFVKYKIGPNTLTFFGLISACVAAILIATGIAYNFWWWWTIPVAILMCGFFDVMDGAVARKTKKASYAGAFLDSMMDRISDFVIIIGIVLSGLISWIIGINIVFLMLMISYSRSKADIRQIDMKGIGIMERGERLVFLIFMFIIESIVCNLTQISIFIYIIGLYIGLLIATFIHRAIYIYKQLKIKEWKILKKQLKI